MLKGDIKEYFLKCKNKEVLENGKCADWELKDSLLDLSAVHVLEQEVQLEFPSEYCEYIMAAAHMFTELEGKFDNFFFEDDVDVVLKIVPQPQGKELKYIREMLKENFILVKEKYLPLGEFDEDGYLCIDLMHKNEIVWIPFEDCVGFTTREQFETEQLHIFYKFDDFIKCFFGKEKHEIED